MGLGFNLFAQNPIEHVLAEVEKNNTTLSAYRNHIDAEKMGNHTGLLPQNPEIEYNYLWGNPTEMGNRTNLGIHQSFDFPTAYAYKSQIAKSKNEQAELEYQKQRKEIRYRTHLVCIDLIYQNALYFEYSNRVAHAKQIADAYKTKFDIGETGILEFNKAQMSFLNCSNDLEQIEIERNSLLAELTRLNGGTTIAFNESTFLPQPILPNFELWYAQAEQNNTVLQWIKQEIVISEKQKQLAKAQSLPKFNAGYMSEKVVGQQFQGISFGMSIPLWENKNTLKYAKARTIAIQNMEADTKLQFYHEKKDLHAKVISLQKNVSDYRNSLNLFSNTELLQKALNKGEISLAAYFYERSLYYESFDKLLEMEQNLYKAIAELKKYL